MLALPSSGGQDAEECGLAGTVGSDDAIDLSLVNTEGEMADDHGLAVSLAEALGLDNPLDIRIGRHHTYLF